MPLYLLVGFLSCFDFYNCCTIQDLSYGYVSRGVPTFPGLLQFRWIKQGEYTIKGITFRANDFKTGEHCGTHLDAPKHFNDLGRTVEQIPIERLIITAILVNATKETGDNYNYTLPTKKLLEWQKEHGAFPDPCVVIVDFGWHRFYPNPKTYVGPDAQDVRSPGISKEAAIYLAHTKKVYGVGVDTISIDQDSNGIAHKVLCDHDMYILENLNLTLPLPVKFNIIALPMKLVNGTGAPARVLAWF